LVLDLSIAFGLGTANHGETNHGNAPEGLGPRSLHRFRSGHCLWVLLVVSLSCPNDAQAGLVLRGTGRSEGEGGWECLSSEPLKDGKWRERGSRGIERMDRQRCSEKQCKGVGNLDWSRTVYIFLDQRQQG